VVRGRARPRWSSGSVEDGDVHVLPERKWGVGRGSDLAEEEKDAEREQREMVDVDRNLLHLPLLRRRSSSSAARGMNGVRRWGALGGEGLGEEWRLGEGSGRSSGFYTPMVDSVLMVSTVADWAAGRCSLGGVVSCVHGCGRLGRWWNVGVRNVRFSVRVHG
jgi:hypothetical protein